MKAIPYREDEVADYYSLQAKIFRHIRATDTWQYLSASGWTVVPFSFVLSYGA